MIKIRYRGRENPVPCIPARLLQRYGGRGLQVIFRVDTGADSTIVPRDAIQAQGYVPHNEIVVADYDSRLNTYETFLVNLVIEEFVFERVEVAASESNTACLGLDILNQLKLTLDGRKKTLTVE